MQNKKYKVAILGGGVAGLSAAHELINRGFSMFKYGCKQVLPQNQKYF